MRWIAYIWKQTWKEIFCSFLKKKIKVRNYLCTSLLFMGVIVVQQELLHLSHWETGRCTQNQISLLSHEKPKHTNKRKKPWAKNNRRARSIQTERLGQKFPSSKSMTVYGLGQLNMFLRDHPDLQNLRLLFRSYNRKLTCSVLVENGMHPRLHTSKTGSSVHHEGWWECVWWTNGTWNCVI